MIFWCAKCQVYVPKNQRQQNRSGRGWKCPACGIGLPRKATFLISEILGPEDLLEAQLRS